MIVLLHLAEPGEEELVDQPMTNEVVTVGRRLGEARRAKRLTQSQTAELLGISPRSLARYEADERVPNSRVLLQLASTYGKAAEWFFETRPSQTPSEAELVMAQVAELRGQYLQEAVHYLDYLQQQQRKSRLAADAFPRAAD
ncbi:MAG: helix-turn-helix transcriptional regulator [Chloroflexi bacterium]|nr:helix-turn-helix transcriptional regulator [Chloroflexota bacterium]